MRDLYDVVESILDIDNLDAKLDKMTGDVAIFDWIKRYLEPHNPYSRFNITSNNTISVSNGRHSVKIVFDGFDELPEYINIESDINYDVEIECKRGSHIKSFRGLPTKAKSMTIRCGYNAGWVGIRGRMPDLDIEVGDRFRLFGDGIESFGKFNIKCGNMTTLKLQTSVDSLKGLKIEGKDVIFDFVNDFNMGDKISKLLTRKAPLNKYRGQYVEPITDAGLNEITLLFRNVIDVKDIFKLGYTQASCLERHNGKLYRCKNW